MTTKIKSGVIGDNVVGITQLNVSDGTNGQVLTTDGSGTLSFSTISGYTDSDVETYLNTSEIYTDATNNRLGIGAASPDSKLHIDGNFDGPLVTIHNTGGATAAYAGLEVETSTTGSYVQRWLNAGTELMRVTGDGKVGIGDVPSSNATGSMSPRLFVDNNLGDGTLGLQIASYHPSIVLSDKSSGLHNYRISHDGGHFSIGYEGGTAGSSNSFTSRLKILSSGNVGIGTDNPAAELHVSGDSIANTFKLIANTSVSGSDATIFRPADNTMAFSTNGAERMRITSGGKVGIGSTSPVAPVTINDKATISFNGNDFVLGHQLYYDSTDDRWERLTGYAGSAVYQTAGNVLFYRTAAGGATGDAVTATESMRIDSSGRVTTPAQPAFRAQQSAASGLGTGNTTIGFDDTVTGAFDIGGNFNNSTNRFTAPVAGIYHFNASIRCDSMNAYFRISIAKNGSTNYYTNNHAIYGVPSGNYENLQVGGILNLAANDYVTVVIYAVTDTDWNSQGEGYFSGYLVG